MRARFGFALAGALVLGSAADARAQVTYTQGVPYSRPYAFKDEPLASINNSYLGYSNFVTYGPDPALGAYTTYRASRAPGYVTAPARPGYVTAPAPARRGFFLFGRRRGYPY